MKNDNDGNDCVSEIIDALASESISRIDFDQLGSWLTEQRTLKSKLSAMRDELDVLRTDYLQRISGMVKAIAVAQRKGNSLESAMELIESLDRLSVDDLVECYRRVSARFRDTFPTSFAGLTTRSRAGAAATHLNDYK